MAGSTLSILRLIRSRVARAFDLYARELIIGASVDPTFGPMIRFGAGGTSVEAVADTALCLPPLDSSLARDVIASTRIARLLRGYRDRPAADMNAIARALVALATLVAEHPDIREIDVNPLLADDTGVIALDADTLERHWERTTCCSDR